MAVATERRENQTVQYDDKPIPTGSLRCAECGAIAQSGAEGWKGYLDDDDLVVLFCPECAGGSSGRLSVLPAWRQSSSP